MHVSVLLLLALAVSLPASALTFQTRLEHAQWQVSGDKFECRLSQVVSGFGSGEFVRKAGEPAVFRLQAKERWLARGSGLLLAAAAPWQPGRGDINLGTVTVSDSEFPLRSSVQQASRLLSGLLEGRSPLLRHRTRHGSEPVEIRLLPVSFAKAYDDYLKCTAGLLPVNYEQIRHSQIGFPGGGIELDPRAHQQLDRILLYMAEDPSVNHIYLDGHSDNSGNRLGNRDLSRRRALAVQQYLMDKGIAQENITLRFHGESYPLVSNNSAANRARNRRVSLRLERETIVVQAVSGQEVQKAAADADESDTPL